MLNNIGLPGFLLLAFLIILSWCFCKIFAKAGFSGFWGLISLVPGGAIVLLLVLAVKDWPTHRGSNG
ncbi:MAG: hypothetical protein ABJP79_01310 [Tateyamaria sp.]|uniref:hypothetical protein n=1 Tax=Tateyamaria sp. TaxID=1929288 RepID=UPI00329B8780